MYTSTRRYHIFLSQQLGRRCTPGTQRLEVACPVTKSLLILRHCANNLALLIFWPCNIRGNIHLPPTCTGQLGKSTGISLLALCFVAVGRCDLAGLNFEVSKFVCNHGGDGNKHAILLGTLDRMNPCICAVESERNVVRVRV